MLEIHKSILPDHEEQFAEVFEQITNLIHHDEFKEAAKILANLHAADLADFLDNINYKIHKKILPFLSDNIKPETLVWLSDSNKQSIITALGIDKSAELVDQLAIEDAIEVIENVSNELRQAIITKLNSAKQTQIIEGFAYPEATVGRIIEKNYIAFQEHWTVGLAIDSIRHGNIERDFHAAIVIDNRSRPVGNILLSTLLKHSRNTPINKLMNNDLKIADAYTELGEIAFIFKQYALTIVPVVNKGGKLIGSISIDNMIYIIEEQTEKDIMQLVGVHTSDAFYNFLYTAKDRFPWLFMNLITACITSIVINHFSETIAKLITLAVIMPIVASLGGNAGTQAMTVTVRAIANKDINQANMLKVITKEILVCGINGLLLAIAGGLLSYIMLGALDLSIIFSVAVFITCLISGFFGSVIPITLHNFEIDPATASGVFLTALTDAFGFFTFLFLAYFFLV